MKGGGRKAYWPFCLYILFGFCFETGSFYLVLANLNYVDEAGLKFTDQAQKSLLPVSKVPAAGEGSHQAYGAFCLCVLVSGFMGFCLLAAVVFCFSILCVCDWVGG